VARHGQLCVKKIEIGILNHFFIGASQKHKPFALFCTNKMKNRFL
jgi:hypothetical protein